MTFAPYAETSFPYVVKKWIAQTGYPCIIEEAPYEKRFYVGLPMSHRLYKVKEEQFLKLGRKVGKWECPEWAHPGFCGEWRLIIDGNYWFIGYSCPKTIEISRIENEVNQLIQDLEAF